MPSHTSRIFLLSNLGSHFLIFESVCDCALLHACMGGSGDGKVAVVVVVVVMSVYGVCGCIRGCMCLYVYVCACVQACVNAWVRACVRVSVYVCV